MKWTSFIGLPHDFNHAEIKDNTFIWAILLSIIYVIMVILLNLSICGYLDLDRVGDIDNRGSTSGYIFTMCGGAIS